MRVEEFLYTYPELIVSSAGEDVFATFSVICPGLSSPKLGKILNAASSYLEGKEFYCEIGTHCGYSLISAAHNNVHQFVGIDNFTLFGDTTSKEYSDSVRAKVEANMKLFAAQNRKLIDSDYKGVSFGPEDKIGVFFIDGEHTREDVHNNFKWAEEYLADNALILVDDISSPGVSDGISDWIKDRDEYTEFFRMNMFYPYKEDERSHWSPVFWNGLSMIKFKRKKSD